MIDADLLARLPDDAKLTITVEARDLRKALEARQGKAVLSTSDAAAEFGWKESDWRRWAPSLEGAKRDGKRWRIPRAAVERKVVELMKLGPDQQDNHHGPRRGGNHGRFRSKAAATQTSADRSPVIPLTGRVSRG